MASDSEELRNIVELNPPWKQAVAEFLCSNFVEGDVIPHGWFYRAFRLEQPQPDTPYKEAEKTQLLFLSYFKRFEEALLKDHHVHIYNKFAVGYEVIKPSEQTGRAEETSLQQIKKELGKLGTRLYSVDFAKLTDKERKDNADALNRLAMLAGMTKKLRESSKQTREISGME